MSLSPGNRIGPYEVVSVIGAGGMGEVYQANDTRLKRVVALKVLPAAFATDSERLARFQRESEVLAALNHPNIAQVFGLEDSESGPAIAMEFVDGPTLGDRLKQGALAVDAALAIARQIVDAIEYAHERGVIHRDLKPANIKVTADGSVKVLDFGLAKAIDTQGASSSAAANSPTLSMAATQAGLILGTAAYMSPEQAKGLVADRRADIWSLGVVLFEMLSGRALYGGETASETMAQVLMTEPDFAMLPESTPPRVRELLRRCLIKDPKKRLQAIGEARIAIDEAINGPGAADIVDTRRVSAWRERAAIGVAALFIIVSAGFAFLLWRREAPAAPAVVQFEVVPPGQIATPPVLSPDGTMMAFGINDGQSVNIWIHAFASGRSEPLPGAEGHSPAILIWSPDSRAIAYSSRGKLKRVDLESRTARVICEISRSPTRAAWGSGGLIVIGGSESGILQVTAAGGELTPLIALDPARQEASLTAPSFLPDGRHFFFMSRQRDGNLKGYIGTVGSPDRQELPGVASEAKFDPSGHILYVHNGALVAQRFDPGQLALSGERVAIADGFVPGILGGLYSMSDTGVLARTAVSTVRSQLTWVDRRGAAIGPAGPAGDYADIELSLDERYVAYEAGNPAADIWVLDIANGVNSRVTAHPVRDADPVWSPDGKTIAFRADRDGGHLYRRSFGQVGDDQLLLPGTDRDSPSSWSTDGRYLLFDRNRGNDIWALPLGESAKPIQLTASTFVEHEGQISPDGRLIAFESDESGAFEIYVQSFPEPGMKRQISSGGAHTARWSRDGKELFYVGGRETLTAVPITTNGTTFSVGAASALFSMTALASEASYDVSKTGRFIVNVLQPNVPDSQITVTMNWTGRLTK